MKRTLQGTIVLLALAGLLTSTAAAQSLGEYARQQRAKKGPAPASVKEYTNDNLPTSGALSTVSASSATTPDSASASASASTSARAAKSRTDAASDKDMAKLETEWRGKFAKQRRDIALLERELDLAIKEQKLMVSDYYRRPPENLQRTKTFEETNAKTLAEIEAKKQALADAQQKLADMQEDLRKAGLPSSWAE